MSKEKKHDLSQTAGHSEKIFKSAEPSLTRMNSAMDSAISDVAVDRAVPIASPTDSETSTIEFSLPLGVPPESEETLGASTAAKAVEAITASMAKVEAAVQSIEAREAEISESHQRAEELLAEVNRVRNALTFNDELRQRIDRTINRTRTLRGNVSK